MMEEGFKIYDKYVRKVAENEGFQFGYNVEHQPGSSEGDGFIGLIFRVIIYGQRLIENEIRDNERLALIIKIPCNDKIAREKYNSMELFRREVFVYNEILPAFDQIQKNWKISEDSGFSSYPKCFFANFDDENSIIIMEDLKERQFLMKNKYEPTDLLHVKKLVIELAKMTAVSLAIRKQMPEIFRKIQTLDDVLCDLMNNEQMKDLAPRNCRLAASLFNNEADLEIRNKLLNLSDCLWTKTKMYINPERGEPYCVFTHGDCWINNLMFSYNSDESIKDICIFDWQMSRYGSPIMDLVLFIYLCTEKSLRAEHMEELLDLYYEKCCITLKKLGCDPQVQFPRSALDEHINKFSLVVLSMGIFAIPILTRYEEIFSDPENAGKPEHKEKIEQYKYYMINIIKDLNKYGNLDV